ncbi:unnamed protein product [Parnassius apollo]|uniref:(apollo) hypothetical protein n=1 Tax=Parnassius apollo TaxID=110799 RepID=A0A8S3XES7_PARAO|nr:unnamed protein product [Parnassius apollo]
MTKNKIKFAERKNLRHTGGGTHPTTNPENADDISSWLPNELVIDTIEFNSDEINQDTKSTVKDVTVEILEEIQTTREVVSIGLAPKPLYTPSKKPERKNKTEKETSDHAESISNTEIECRKEVHQAQMANEERKARNLDLDETLIKLKIEYYKKTSSS